MPTPPRHFKEEIQDWLDQRLDAATCDEVERHLETCAECRREFESVGWSKQVAARRFAPAAPPAGLRENILRALRAEESPPNLVAPAPVFWSARRKPLLAAAAILLAAAILAFTWFLRPPRLPELVARDYRAYQSGKLALQLATADVKEMETFFTQHGVPFNTRVFDLGMMNYSLVGGRVEQLGRRARASFIYRGQGNQILLCQMYAGKVAELPSGAVQRENKGIKFYIYHSNGLTRVFWQEGSVVCVLISDIESEQVIQLAFAKAMTI